MLQSSIWRYLQEVFRCIIQGNSELFPENLNSLVKNIHFYLIFTRHPIYKMDCKLTLVLQQTIAIPKFTVLKFPNVGHHRHRSIQFIPLLWKHLFLPPAYSVFTCCQLMPEIVLPFSLWHSFQLLSFLTNYSPIITRPYWNYQEYAG